MYPRKNSSNDRQLRFALISSRASEGSIAARVSASIDPSRCKCSSALAIDSGFGILSLLCHNSCGMTPQEVQEIVAGNHGDPFSVLGPHQTENGWEVRAFLPQAMDVAVSTGGGFRVGGRIGGEGFFVATHAQDPGHYKLHVTLWSGAQIEMGAPSRFPPLISDFDLHIHAEGTQYESYRTMGAHLIEYDGVRAARFTVWAPNAEAISVVGDFNEWDERRHPMRNRAGVWEIFIPGVSAGLNYKYSVRAQSRGYRQQKADPYGFASEAPPKSASIVCNLEDYKWEDQQWMEARAHKDHLKEPMSVYE